MRVGYTRTSGVWIGETSLSIIDEFIDIFSMRVLLPGNDMTRMLLSLPFSWRSRTIFQAAIVLEKYPVTDKPAKFAESFLVLSR